MRKSVKNEVLFKLCWKWYRRFYGSLLKCSNVLFWYVSISLISKILYIFELGCLFVANKINWLLVPFAAVLPDRHFQRDCHWHAHAFSLAPAITEKSKSIGSIFEILLLSMYSSRSSMWTLIALTFLSHCWCKYLNRIFFFSVTITASGKMKNWIRINWCAMQLPVLTPF